MTRAYRYIFCHALRSSPTVVYETYHNLSTRGDLKVWIHSLYWFVSPVLGVRDPVLSRAGVPVRIFIRLPKPELDPGEFGLNIQLYLSFSLGFSTSHARLPISFQKMEAAYYDNIVEQQRLEPEFFRVGFYGRKFPFFLRVSWRNRSRITYSISEHKGVLKEHFKTSMLFAYCLHSE